MKKSWIMCAVSFLLAVISFAFLPDRIPTHFSGGTADGFSGRMGIFIFPLMQVIIIGISNLKAVKYWSMNIKMPKTENQYFMIIFGIIVLIFAVQTGIIMSALF